MQTLLDRFHVSAADIPVVICRGTIVLRNPDNQTLADALGLNAAIDRDGAARSRDRRRGTVGTRGGGLWRVGGTRRPDGRSQRAGRAGGFELENRELPRLSDRNHGRRADRPRLRADAEVCRVADDRARSAGADVRSQAVRGGIERRHANGRAVGDHRQRRALSQAAGGQHVAVRRRRGVLRRDAHGAAAVRRRGSHRRRRRQLSGASGGVPWRDVRARAPAGSGRRPGRQHVAVPDSADRGQPEDHAAHADRDRRRGRRRSPRRRSPGATVDAVSQRRGRSVTSS